MGFGLVLSRYSFLLFAGLSVPKRRDSAVLHIKKHGGGENHTSCLMSNARAEGSGWQESHLFQWGWRAADPKRARTAPARQQDLPKHGWDAAENLASHERASPRWHTTGFCLLFCFLGVFSRTGLVVSLVWILVVFAWLSYFWKVYLLKKRNWGFLKMQEGLEVKRVFGRWEITFLWRAFSFLFKAKVLPHPLAPTEQPAAQFPPTTFCKLFWVMNAFRQKGLVWKTLEFFKLEKIPNLIKHMKISVTSFLLCHQNESEAQLLLLLSRAWEILKVKVNLTLTSAFYLNYPCSTTRFQPYSLPAESITFPDKTIFQSFRF